MTVYKRINISGSGGNNQNPFGWIGSIVMLSIGLLLAYLVIKGIFTLLFWLSPILFIAGVAIDPNGALNLGKSLLKISRQNPLIPIGVVILSAIFFPLVPGILGALAGGFLLSKALIKKKIQKVFNQGAPTQESEEFVEYEDVTEDESFLELPEIEKETRQAQRPDNEYDNLFEQ
ncbi:MAG: hypothetical protein AAGA77_20510 [Bacteroidota bacterium]